MGRKRDLKRVLVIAGDQFHPGEVVLAGISRAVSDGFAVDAAPDGPLRSIARNTACIVLAKLNVCSPTDPTPWADAESDRLIGDFVRNGGQLLVVHAGTVRYGETRFIREITGGAFLQHPKPCPVTLLPAGAHAMIGGLEPFVVEDEHYFVETDADVEVFLLSRSEHGEQPAGWTKPYGAGEASVITAGHFANVWTEPTFGDLLARAMHPSLFC